MDSMRKRTGMISLFIDMRALDGVLHESRVDTILRDTRPTIIYQVRNPVNKTSGPTPTVSP